MAAVGVCRPELDTSRALSWLLELETLATTAAANTRLQGLPTSTAVSFANMALKKYLCILQIESQETFLLVIAHVQELVP